MDQNAFDKIDFLDKCIEIQKKLFSAECEKELLTIVESIFEELIPLDYSGLYIHNSKTQNLDLKLAHGFSEEERLIAEKTAMDRHPGKVFKTGTQIYVPDTENDPDNNTVDSPRTFNVRTRLYQPIFVKEKCIGVFVVVSKRPDEFSDLEKKIFEFICKVFGKARLNLLQVLEIKEVNKELERLSLLATHTDNAVIITDKSGKIEWVNSAFTQITGYLLNEALNKTPGRLLQGALTNDDGRNILRSAIQNKEKAEVTIINYRKNGEAYDAQIQIYPLFDEKGNHTNFISLQRDVSETVTRNAEILNQQKRFRAIVDTLPDQLFVLKTDGTVIEFYSPNKSLLLLPENQIIGTNLNNFLDAKEAEAHMHCIKVTSAGGVVEPYQYNLEFPSGTMFFEARYASLGGDKILAVIRNITKEKKSEIERDRQSLYYQIISDFTSKFILVDSDRLNTLIQDFLQEIGQFFGVDRSYIFEFKDEEDIMTNTFEWCAVDIEPQIDYLQALPCSNLQWWVDKIKNNHEVHIPNVASLPEDATSMKELLESQNIKTLLAIPMVVNRKIKGFYGYDSVKSTKEWTNNELALLKLTGEVICNVFSRQEWENDRDRFRIVFENAAFGAVIINKAEKIIYANKYLANLLNCSLEQLHKLNFSNVFPSFLNGNSKVGYDEMTKAGSLESFELNLPMADGTVAVLLTNAVSIRSTTNDEMLVAYTFSDITYRKEQEKATSEALDIVSEQNKRLLNFSYIVSHNIRSHASNISGIAGILAEKPEPAPEVRHQFVDGLILSSANLDATLRHLNELLNIQSRVNIHNETINFEEVVQRTIQSIALDVKANKVVFDMKMDENFTLMTDRAYLDSIVLNLLSNAIKYRKPDVSPQITIKTGENKQMMWFSVSDNGLGIDLKKYGDRVFGMFKTFHGNRDARGIGLFITRNQIEALGGKIEVESTPNIGTTFTVYLPK
jgi:PAS domain S-box-containing protein